MTRKSDEASIDARNQWIIDRNKRNQMASSEDALTVVLTDGVRGKMVSNEEERKQILDALESVKTAPIALDSEKKYRIQFCTGCAQYLLAELGQKECISCKTAFKYIGDDDPSALDTQEGGSHYKDMKIQPVEFITANDLDFLQGNVVKYIARHKAKNGAQDVRKALHYCQLILELQYGEKP